MDLKTKLSIIQSLLNFKLEVALKIIHLFGYEMPLNYQNWPKNNMLHGCIILSVQTAQIQRRTEILKPG